MGRAIADSVRALLKQQTVKMTRYGVDKYGRILATIELNGADVAEHILLKGWVWYMPYKKGLKNILQKGLRTRYANAEKFAKENKLGIWGTDEKAISPSDWRNSHRTVLGN